MSILERRMPSLFLSLTPDVHDATSSMGPLMSPVRILSRSDGLRQMRTNCSPMRYPYILPPGSLLPLHLPF